VLGEFSEITGCILRYEFPARGPPPPVKITWFDGNKTVPRPEELEEGHKLPDIGAVVIGDKGKIVYGSHGAGGAKLIPDAKMKAYQPPASSIPRSKGHYADWIAAAKGGKPAGSNFDYGVPLTEVALLGNLALRFKGQKLEWDAQAQKIANFADANRFIHPLPRKGWAW